MSAKGRIIVLAFAAMAVTHTEACAQVARVRAARHTSTSVGADSLQLVRQFVQGFYDWYTPLALARHPFPAEYYVLSNSGRYLDQDLASALRADSVAEQAGSAVATRQTLDFDPFLESQDPCGPYEVADVVHRGDAFRVPMRPCRAKGTGPTVEVRAIGGHWRITNVFYGTGDLKSYLCQWAKADLRRDKRPAKC